MPDTLREPQSWDRSSARAWTRQRAEPEQPGIFLLSFFDGIGVAALAAQDHRKVAHLFTWEVDEAAQAVCDAQFGQIASHRGAIQDDSAEAIVAEINRLDPHAVHTILVTGGPPCPDFSRVNDDAAGRAGGTGRLFGVFCDILDALESHLKGRSLAIVVENVVMACHGDIAYFSKRLRCEPILIDAADWGVVHRPRLWWTRLDWTKCKYKWSRQGRLYRLHSPGPVHRASDFELRGYTLSRELTAGTKLWPCFTTPSPTSSGRAAPKSTRSKIDSGTRARWLEAGRAYAPWHFQEHAMVTSPDGILEVVPVHLKEQAHLLPPDFTAAAPSSKDRHRLLANSWHRGVSSFLLSIVLKLGVHVIGDDAPEGEQISTSGGKDFQSILRAAREQPLPMSRVRAPVSIEMYPPRSMWEHWLSSSSVVPQALLPPAVEPGIRATLLRGNRTLSSPTGRAVRHARPCC